MKNMNKIYTVLVTIAAVLIVLGKTVSSRNPVPAMSSEEDQTLPSYSTSSLMQVVEKERKTAAIFTKNRDKLPLLKKLVDKLKLSNDSLQYNNEKNRSLHYVEHPVNAYSLIKRWVDIRNVIYDTHDYFPMRSVLTYMKVPERQDLHIAISGLLRLQSVYKLNTKEMIAGKIKGVDCAQRISREATIEIGNFAYGIGEYGLAAEWIEYGISQSSLKIAEDKLNTVYERLMEIYIKLEDPRKALDYAEKIYDANIYNIEFNDMYDNLTSHIKGLSGDYVPGKWERTKSPIKTSYEKLCYEGVKAKKSKSNKRLSCYLRTSKVIPYRQYKEEVMSDNPRIVLYHDAIYNIEAYYFLRDTYLKLHRPKETKMDDVEDENIDFSKYTDVRFVGKSAFIYDNKVTYAKKFTTRMSDMTGLNIDFSDKFSKSEAFELVNYGIGGHRDPHTDYLDEARMENREEYLKHSGNRMATVLFFLSYVNQGGGIAFPHIDLYVPSVRNGALFWYNTKRNGEQDRRTVHGSCPALLGSKWELTKRVMERGQEFTRRCGLTTDANDDI